MTGTRPHYRNSYDRRARHLRAAAWANPTTARCTICHRTYAELPNHTTGRRPWWVAGHITPGQIDGPLQLECSHCSNAEAPTRRQAIQHPTRADWYG